MDLFTNVSLDQVIAAQELCYELFDLDRLPGGFTLLGRFGGSAESRMPQSVFGTVSDTLYIAIRGARHTHDITRSLDMSNTPLLFGEVHPGCLAAARYAIEHGREYIDSATGPMVVTGHSQGASVATIIAIILRLEEGRAGVIGISVGARPVLSPDLQAATRSFMISLVYNRDLVPQLTNKNVQRLFQSVQGDDPERAVETVRDAVVPMFLGPGAVDDDPMFLPSIGPILYGDHSSVELHAGGVVLGIIDTGESVTLVPYVDGIFLDAEVIKGMADHRQLAVIRALKSLQ
jgi:hypothetical protein